MSNLYFRCMACGDSQTVSTVRRRCLCGAASARVAGDTVVVAGPGRVGRTPFGEDRDEMPVTRRSVAVGT